MVVSTNTFTGSMDGTSLTKESRKSSEYSPEPSMIIRSSGGKDVRKLTLVENIALVMTLLVILLVIALVIVVIVVVVKRNKVKNVFHFTRSFSKSIIGEFVAILLCTYVFVFCVGRYEVDQLTSSCSYVYSVLHVVLLFILVL